MQLTADDVAAAADEPAATIHMYTGWVAGMRMERANEVERGEREAGSKHGRGGLCGVVRKAPFCMSAPNCTEL